jgi:hypothetical protein
MRKSASILFRIHVLLAFLLGCAFPALAMAQAPAGHDAFAKLPLHFIQNQGQLDARVAYYIQGRATSVYFTSEGVTIALTGRAATAAFDSEVARQRWAVKLDFVGANLKARPEGEDPTAAVVSYFKGPREQWKTGLKTYAGLVYRDLWPGIDLVFNGTVDRLKYTFLIHPGADPDSIKLAYRGATAVTLTSGGELEVSTPVGGFRDESPYAYQEVGGERVEVAAAYAMESQASGAVQEYGFSLGAYDPEKPLVLDPAMLVYAGYIGGAGSDQGAGIAVDGAGNAYVTGTTDSSEATFPVTVGPDLTFNGSFDAFVAKVNAAGTNLIYAGYIGGAGSDQGVAIAVDSAGNAYVTGATDSSEATFPVMVGPDLTFNGAVDAFVAKVNAAGTGLVYAGYIGGAGNDQGIGIAVDGAGNAYVSGATDSSEASFPVTVGPDLTFNGGSFDAFVAKVNATGTALAYAGYIGGAGFDQGVGIAVDNAGNAYVSGLTDSSESSFPVAVGPDLTFNGSFDAFVAKVNATGTALAYAGYIGGTGTDQGLGIAVDSAGNAYVTGLTDSSEATFPVMVGPDLTFNGSFDAFVAKVNATGTGLVYAGYIGGAGFDQGVGMAVDSGGKAYVSGATDSSEATFPVTAGPDLTFNGSFDAFVAKVNAAGTGLVYAGYIGGAGNDQGAGIAVDSAGNAYVTGLTDSSEATFPVTVGPDLTFNGAIDAFVAKVAAMQDEVSTPGKVTGGGSIAPDGTILTLATLLIQSGTNPGGQATFGFVVEFTSGAAAPAGNLTYNDHEAQVRIKAIAYQLLVISAVSPVCPTGKHARFTGTAEVNGVQQNFEVDVDDCGEPGNADTFSIRTATYFASGILLSGNIQIHPAQ